MTKVHQLAAGEVWAEVRVSVPGGSHGEIHVPLVSPASGTIYESGKLVWSAGRYAPAGAVHGVTPGSNDGRFVSFVTAPGNYKFTVSA